MSPDRSVSVVTKVEPERQTNCGSIHHEGKKFFFSPAHPHLSCDPKSFPVQWVMGTISPGLKRQRCEKDHSRFSNAKTKKAYTVPTYTYSAVLTFLACTRTTLHFRARIKFNFISLCPPNRRFWQIETEEMTGCLLRVNTHFRGWWKANMEWRLKRESWKKKNSEKNSLQRHFVH